MNWQVLIFLQSILAALSIIAARVLAREKQAAKASFVINAGWYVSLYIFGLILLPWIGPVHNVWGSYWLRFLGGGLSFALTNVCTYKTMVYFDAALASIVGTANALFTAIGSALVLNENLTTKQIIGGFILLWAIIYALIATRSGARKVSLDNIKKGSMFAILAGILYAVAIVNEKSLLSHMSISSYMVFGWGGQLIMALLAVAVFQPKSLKLLLNRKFAVWTAAGGVLRALAGICFMFAEVKSNNVGLVTVISNFKIILVVIFGWWLLKERQKLAQKLQAAAGSIAGLTILFWK